MTIKSDKWIRRMAAEHRMIEPFEPNQVKYANGHRIVSYGTSSYGYDIRCSDEFKLFTNINSVIVDPKNFDSNSFVDVKGDVCLIPPNSFALARTVEYFRIPRNVLTICLGKSTYARCGIIVNVTPFEPEWEGYVTSANCPIPAINAARLDQLALYSMCAKKIIRLCCKDIFYPDVACEFSPGAVNYDELTRRFFCGRSRWIYDFFSNRKKRLIPAE